MEALTCIHCHSPFRGTGSFCCHGCQAVYNFINSKGLSQFYKILNPENKLPTPGSPFLDNNSLSTYVTQNSNGLNQIALFSDSLVCSACHWLVAQIPAVFSQIKSTRSQFGENIIRVEFENTLPPGEIFNIFTLLGISAIPITPSTNSTQIVRRNFLTKIAFSFASLLGTMHTSLFLYAGLLSSMNVRQNQILGLLSLAVALPAVFIGGLSFYKNAYSALKLRTPSIDLLVSFSVALGFFASLYNLSIGKNEYYFDAITMLITFLLLGRYLAFEIEFQMAKRTSLDPVLNQTHMPKQGEELAIQSGAIVPCDGVIVSGESFADSSWLTGESELQKVSKGSEVYHGSLNIGDEVIVKCTSSGASTKLAKLFSELGQIDKAAIPSQFKKIEQGFVGAIIIFAILLLFTNLSASTYVALILVVCPCALGLAIPSSFISAVYSLFRKGIYFKRASVLKELSQINTVVLDVTGTITNYRRDVISCTWHPEVLQQLNLEETQINQVIISMVSRSNHPVLKPLQSYFEKYAKFSDLKILEVLSKGIQAQWNNHEFKLGSSKFCNISNAESDLFLTADDKLICQFDLAVQIKPEAEKVIKHLSQGHDFFIATGSSNHKGVLEISKILGISPERVYTRQSPQDKLKLVEKLVSQGRKVMMVGDGYNDVQAFKKAHIGVAISGAIGPSLNFADIYLSQSTLDGL